MADRKRDFKAEYARRVARAAAAGKSRSEARGHGAKGGLSESQRRRAREDTAIRAFAERQARRWEGPDRTEEFIRALKTQIKAKGFGFLRKVQAKVDELERRRRAAPYDKHGRKPLGISMDDLGDEFELPPELAGYH